MNIKLLLLLLLLIIILLILFNDFNTPEWLEPESDSTREIEKVIFNDSFNNYRLGDVFKYWHNYSNLFRLNHHIDSFPNSIAAEYMQKSSTNSDINTLKKIINERNNQNITPDLVIHIRIGDIICDIVNRYYRKCYSAYGNKEWWSNLITIIKGENIKSIGIIAGSHYKKCLNISFN